MRAPAPVPLASVPSASGDRCLTGLPVLSHRRRCCSDFATSEFWRRRYEPEIKTNTIYDWYGDLPFRIFSERILREEVGLAEGSWVLQARRPSFHPPTHRSLARSRHRFAVPKISLATFEMTRIRSNSWPAAQIGCGNSDWSRALSAEGFCALSTDIDPKLLARPLPH